jgi:cytochrome c peroxidase
MSRSPRLSSLVLRPASCLALLAALLVTACGGGSGDDSSTSTTSSATSSATLSPLAALGEQIFHDTALSASEAQSCASCHDAAHAHAPANANAAQFGGRSAPLTLQGSRVAGSIRYLAYNRAFRFDAEGTPTGGFFWDGRAASLADQALGPFTNPVEMANADATEVVSRLRNRPYAAAFQALFGADVFNDPDATLRRVGLALQAYQKEDAAFAPFSSKYDAFLQGRTTLNAAEKRGLALFNSPAKGNCAACHPSARASDGSLPLFTDFSFDALGVPRNWDVPASFNDLGLCAAAVPEVQALSDAARAQLCGLFKVPSLRNVAVRQSYFHNGRFHTLREAVTFYVQRDTHAAKWYTLADRVTPDVDANGAVVRFHDLPEAYRGNVNQTEAPYNRGLGGTPALNEAEIEDVLAFLATLTDGWTP